MNMSIILLILHLLFSSGSGAGSGDNNYFPGSDILLYNQGTMSGEVASGYFSCLS